MDGNSCIAKHGLGAGCGDDEALIWKDIRRRYLTGIRVLAGPLDLVGKAGKHTKLEFFLGIVAGYTEERASLQFFLIDLYEGSIDQTTGGILARRTSRLDRVVLSLTHQLTRRLAR